MMSRSASSSPSTTARRPRRHVPAGVASNLVNEETERMKKDRHSLAAVAFVVLGGIMMVIGWLGVSQATEVIDQLPYLFSGGLGGLVCLLIGLGLYIARNHARSEERRVGKEWRARVVADQ